MNRIVSRLLPSPASNEYYGSKIALYFFGLVSVVMMGRSLVHLFKDDAGINSIASMITFSGSPDPDLAVYLFASLWGLQQLIMAAIYLLVLWRYRSLISLMYLTLLLEWGGRLLVGGVLHPLDESFFTGTTPGAVAALPLFVILLVMFGLSMTRRQVVAGD